MAADFCILQICGAEVMDTYLTKVDDRYVACKGSKPESRGFTCGLWLMFHTCADRCESYHC